MIIELTNVSKRFGVEPVEVTALRDVDLMVDQGGNPVNVLGNGVFVTHAMARLPTEMQNPVSSSRSGKNDRSL